DSPVICSIRANFLSLRHAGNFSRSTGSDSISSIARSQYRKISPGIGGLSSREAEAAYKANARLYVVRGYTFRENHASAQICVTSARSASSLGKDTRGHNILMRRNVFCAIAAFSSGVIGLKTAIVKHPHAHRLTLLSFIQIIPPPLLIEESRGMRNKLLRRLLPLMFNGKVFSSFDE